MSDELPVCLVLGAGGKNPDTIIEGVIGDLSVAETDADGFSFYNWSITNKYYTASIIFCKLTDKSAVSDCFAERVDAAIIYFDSNAESGLDEAADWITFLNTFNVEVKILVCDQCSMEEDSNSISKIKAQQWCIKHGFELVELDPSEKPDPDDDFPETLGMQRIIQALHSHSWPNLELRSGADKSRIDHLSRLLLGEDADASMLDSSLLQGDDETLDRQMSEGIDSFEELFQSMSLMKNQAGVLQGDERKAYAEKITMAFWQAIEGDAAEIEGLDSSADEN